MLGSPIVLSQESLGSVYKLRRTLALAHLWQWTWVREELGVMGMEQGGATTDVLHQVTQVCALWVLCFHVIY